MDLSNEGIIIFLPFIAFGFLSLILATLNSNTLLVESSLPVGVIGFFIGLAYVYLKAKKLDKINERLTE